MHNSLLCYLTYRLLFYAPHMYVYDLYVNYLLLLRNPLAPKTYIHTYVHAQNGAKSNRDIDHTRVTQ